MLINYTCKKNVLIIDICGDIDHMSAAKVKRHISEAITKFKTNKIILNMSNVEFMDSSAIGMLIGRYKEISLINGEMVLSEVGVLANKILKLSGIYKLIKNFENNDKAISYLNGGDYNE